MKKPILKGIVRFYFVVVFSLLPTMVTIFAQSAFVIRSRESETQLNSPRGGYFSATFQNGKLQSIQKPGDPKEVVRIIVTFRGQPLAYYKAYNKRVLMKGFSIEAAFSALQSEHSSFKSSLSEITKSPSGKSGFQYFSSIKREYYTALNGIAMECSRGLIDQIRGLLMVKNIGPDSKVKINLKESIHQIRADKVQDSLGYKGKGVLIGELDTGIDYNNPALGGGFGTGFRVIGGYDFVNNDNDPMDDHGHGTHVAGIIGANGGDTLRGVAPGVKFLAVKVLDANGTGWISNIIAGIDYCLDPDGNPGTNDAADILNMSFGGNPVPYNPVDSAVNNATKAGILSVIAAGNSGLFGYGTVGSPGTSESALTVGACDSIDQIAVFSSIGPDLLHFLIKPEVVAPGVNILSTVLHDSLVSKSGTSMATPHVAGVAALLKEQHPAWSPEDLKAAIINSAHFLGDAVSPFMQGNGRVDALSAASLGMAVEPSVFNFGIVDLGLNVWKDTIQFKLKNFRKISQQIDLQNVQGVPAGARLTFSQSVFQLSPSEEKTLTAILTIPASVPINKVEPYAYLGNIEFVSDSDRIRVPFSFFKSTTLAIICDVPPVALVVFNRQTATIKTLDIQPGATKYVIPVPEGSLDIFAAFKLDTLELKSTYIVDHRDVHVSELTYNYLRHEEATIKLFSDPVYDIHNKPINIDSTNYAMFLQFNLDDKKTNYGSYFYYVDYPAGDFTSKYPIYLTPLDSLFYLSQSLFTSGNKEFTGLTKYQFGIASQHDIAIPSGSDNLTGFGLVCDYTVPPFENPLRYAKEIYMNFKYWTKIPFGGMTTSYRNGFPYSSISNCCFSKQKIDLDQFRYNSIDLSVGYRNLDTIAVDYPSVLHSPEFNCNSNGEAIVEQRMITHTGGTTTQSDAYNYEILKQGDTFHIENNEYLNFPYFKTYLNEDKLSLIPYDAIFDDGVMQFQTWLDGGIKQSNGVFEQNYILSPYFCSPQFSVETFSHNQTQSKSPIKGMQTFCSFDKVKKTPGLYLMLVNAHPYSLLGQSGQSRADFEYQMPGTSVWPTGNTKYLFPSVNLIQVSVDGTAAKWVRPDQTGKVRIVFNNPDSSISMVNLSLVPASGDEIQMPATYSGRHEFTASIPASIPAGFIDLIARASDTHGNKIELTASPAFYYGSSLDNVHFDARLNMKTYYLNNINTLKYNIGDTLKYAITYNNYGNKTARNITVTLPATAYFRPVGPTTIAIDSLGVNDSVKISLKLVFLGKQASTDTRAYYTPAIAWNSNGTSYLRKYNLLVDLQGLTTNVSTAGKGIPDKFELHQNYPNPFNPSTTIRYDIAKAGHVSLDVYNILGQHLAALVNELKPAGTYTVVWDGHARNGGTASGVYFLRIRAGDYVKTIKMLMMK